MKLLKSYLRLRSTMTDDRLTGAGTDVHPPESEKIDVGEIIRRFMVMPAKSRPARQVPTADMDIDATDTTTTEAVAPAVKRRRLCDM